MNKGRLHLDKTTGATVWQPPIKLNAEQRQRARQLEDWIADSPEEAAFELIHLRDMCDKLNRALAEKGG